MSWPYELQEKSVKFRLESSMGMHSCCAICLCHISGRKGFIPLGTPLNISGLLK